MNNAYQSEVLTSTAVKTLLLLFMEDCESSPYCAMTCDVIHSARSVRVHGIHFNHQVHFWKWHYYGRFKMRLLTHCWLAANQLCVTFIPLPSIPSAPCACKNLTSMVYHNHPFLLFKSYYGLFTHEIIRLLIHRLLTLYALYYGLLTCKQKTQRKKY